MEQTNLENKFTVKSGLREILKQLKSLNTNETLTGHQVRLFPRLKKIGFTSSACIVISDLLVKHLIFTKTGLRAGVKYVLSDYLMSTDVDVLVEKILPEVMEQTTYQSPLSILNGKYQDDKIKRVKPKLNETKQKDIKILVLGTSCFFIHENNIQEGVIINVNGDENLLDNLDNITINRIKECVVENIKYSIMTIINGEPEILMKEKVYTSVEMLIDELKTTFYKQVQSFS